MPFHGEPWEEIEDRERRYHEASRVGKDSRLDELEAWIRDLAAEECMCVYHAGDCPSCRARALFTARRR